MVQFLSYVTLNDSMTLKSGLEITQDHSNWDHSKAWMRFPIPIPNYGSILHQFRDKARYWSKIVILSYPLALDVPVRICIAVYAQYRRVTDKETDRQKDRHLVTA